MKITCPICKEEVNSQLDESLLNTVINEIKREHPEWVTPDGTCDRCVSLYLHLIEGHGGHA